MKRLDIQITKAALKSFSVDLKEGKPEVSATIALLTEGGKQITEYSISTDSWQKDNQFDLPLECISPIVIMARQLEYIVTKHCRDSQLALPANVSIPQTLTTLMPIEDVTVEDIADESINLDDIPF